MNFQFFKCLGISVVLAGPFSFLSSPLQLTTASEIADQSELPLLNPDFAKRHQTKLRLHNGLELLLISDEQADHSAASVAVEVGSWNDPQEFPGMAHFCEHMLFMGTKKYPEQSAFMASVSDYGGMTNAQTSSHRTIYMFSSHSTGFLPLLDQFAHFFIDPLFNPAHISREMHAVDQEFAKNIENDGWRSAMIFKETGNPEHPNRMFNCGNSQTLSKIPQHALIEWHRQHYGSNRMHVVLYSSLPLDLLKEKAIEAFSQVPSTAPVKIHADVPLTSQGQRGHITYIKPIQDKRNATLLWELPLFLSDDPTKSAQLVAYTLKRGQKYSLHEQLKAEQLIDDLAVEVIEIGGKERCFFEISLDLTEKGMQQPETAILRVFQSLALLKKTGVPNYLFQESNAMAQLKYQYQSRIDAFGYVMQLASTMPDEPLETYPKHQILASSYSPQKIAEVTEWLTPERCVILFLAPPHLTNVIMDRQEKWMGAEYAIRPISPAWMDAWANATPHPKIHLPEPNPFIPSRLEIAADPSLGDAPFLIASNELGIAYYSRSPQFKNPESVMHIHFLSPELNLGVRSEVLASLYCTHLTEILHSALSAAMEANLGTWISTSQSRIHIRMEGFSENASILLQEILRQMSCPPPTQEQFALYVNALEKQYSNAEKILALYQAKDLLDSVVYLDKTTKREKLHTLREISYSDFLSFQKKLFEKTYVEALFAGNLTLKEAESAWLDVIHLFNKTAYHKEEHFHTKVASLPEGPFSITQTTETQGHAAILLIDEGSFTHPKRAAQDILSIALKEGFFNELRTKQKTGYIATSEGQEVAERLFQVFLVQSNSHQPEDLLYRYELFLEEFLENFPTYISEERFEMLRKSALQCLQNRFYNLSQKSALWDLLAFQYGGDFQFIEKRIAALEELSYEELTRSAHEFFSRSNRKRLAILYEGKINSPFAYERTTPKQIVENVLYAPRPTYRDCEKAL